MGGCLGQGAGHPRGPASALGWKEKYISPSGEGGRTLQAERTAGAKRECERAGVSGGGEKLRDDKARGMSVCVRACACAHARTCMLGADKGWKGQWQGRRPQSKSLIAQEISSSVSLQILRPAMLRFVQPYFENSFPSSQRSCRTSLRKTQPVS